MGSKSHFWGNFIILFFFCLPFVCLLFVLFSSFVVPFFILLIGIVDHYITLARPLDKPIQRNHHQHHGGLDCDPRRSSSPPLCRWSTNHEGTAQIKENPVDVLLDTGDGDHYLVGPLVHVRRVRPLHVAGGSVIHTCRVSPFNHQVSSRRQFINTYRPVNSMKIETRLQV